MYTKTVTTTFGAKARKTVRVLALAALALSPLLSSIAIAEGNTSASTATMGHEGGLSNRAQFNASRDNTGAGSNARNMAHEGGVYFDSNVNSTTCFGLSKRRDRYSDEEYGRLEERCTQEGYFREEVHSRTQLR